MITKELANKIVLATSNKINYNINIMNVEGVIIASQDQSRIDTKHEGAILAIDNNRSFIVNKNEANKWKGVQPGVNLPIIFQNKIIGVIGVTGNPKEVETIGNLVKITAELMVQQEYVFSKMDWQQELKSLIIEQLIKGEPFYNEIYQDLHLLNIKIISPFLTVLINLNTKNIANRMLINQLEKIGKNHPFIISFISATRIVILVQGISLQAQNKAIEDIYRVLNSSPIKFKMVYSLPFYDLANFGQSYKDCEITLKLSSKKCLSFSKIEANALIYQINENITKRFSNRVLSNLSNEKIKTLEVFFQSDLNLQQAANELFIHRNTLIYRLDKIQEETNYNPRKFHDALTLTFAIWSKRI